MKNDDFQFIPAAPRPSYDTPMTRLEPTVAASLKQVRSDYLVFQHLFGKKEVNTKNFALFCFR